MKKKGYYIWLFLIGIQMAVYFFLLRRLAEDAYHNEAPGWFDNLIQAVYPRFYIEKHRFDLYFFLKKADQVALRFCGVQLLALVGLFSYHFFPDFRRKFISFWQPAISINRVRMLGILFYSGMIFFTYEWYGYLLDLSKASAFYKPLLLLRILQIGFPAPAIILMCCVTLWLSCMAVIFRFKTVISGSIAAALFVLLQGWLYSFEKLDHTFSTFTYAALLMPFLIYQGQKAIINKQQLVNGWPLQLICVCIGMAYLLAGLEKLLISGSEWLKADTFRAYIFLHQAPLGLQLAKIEWLCVLLPALAMLFQLGFIGILFFPRFRFVFLLAGIGFHIGTYLLLGVGGYANAWVFVYIFFL